MVHDRNPLFVTLVDKIECKNFVRSKIGKGFTPATFLVAERSADVDPSTLPRNYALKVNHASGGVILISEEFPRGGALPRRGGPMVRFRLHPEDADFSRIGPVLDDWLNIGYGSRKGEWAYSLVPRRIFAEEYLTTSSPFPPPDFKFFVFSGRCHAVRVFSHSAAGRSVHHFNRDGVEQRVTFTPFGELPPRMVTPTPELPTALTEMRALAEELGRDLDFVRVDMFEIEGRIVVGEMTIYPSGGAARITPKSLDYELGAAWRRGKEA
jgi:hypothetical protein